MEKLRPRLPKDVISEKPSLKRYSLKERVYKNESDV
jgi:hypothetical protein